MKEKSFKYKVFSQDLVYKSTQLVQYLFKYYNMDIIWKCLIDITWNF